MRWRELLNHHDCATSLKGTATALNRTDGQTQPPQMKFSELTWGLLWPRPCPGQSYPCTRLDPLLPTPEEQKKGLFAYKEVLSPALFAQEWRQITRKLLNHSSSFLLNPYNFLLSQCADCYMTLFLPFASELQNFYLNLHFLKRYLISHTFNIRLHANSKK